MSDPFRQPPRAEPPVLDMTPEGEFRDPPPKARSGFDRLLARTGGVAMLVAVAAGGLVLAGLALIFVSLLLPVLIGAGAVAAASLWWRMRRLRKQGVVPPRFVVVRRGPG